VRTESEQMAEYLPHWKCKNCGFRVFEAEICLAEQVCKCGHGEGIWYLENGHLVQWAAREVG